VFTSQPLIASLELETNLDLSDVIETEVIQVACPSKVSNDLRVSKFHTLIVCFEAETNLALSEVMASDSTPPWPLIVLSSLPVCNSHTLIVPSGEPDIILALSEVMVIESIGDFNYIIFWSVMDSTYFGVIGCNGKWMSLKRV
jgi:hypothetical protein